MSACSCKYSQGDLNNFILVYNYYTAIAGGFNSK